MQLWWKTIIELWRDTSLYPTCLLKAIFKEEWSPLLQAAFRGNIELVEILLNGGAYIAITGPVRLF